MAVSPVKHAALLKTVSTMLLCSGLLCLASAFAQSSDHLEVADYLDFEKVSDAQISPDGKQIIFTRQWVDKKRDRMASALWIVESDGSRPRFLIEGSNAEWSPSGDRIAYLGMGDNDKPQLFVRWMDDDASVTQVTRLDVTPSSPKWSPDGTRIAFVAIVPATETWAIDMPAAPEGAEWSKPPRIINNLHYRQDRLGLTDPGYSHLFVVPAHAGVARQLTGGSWHVGARFGGLFMGAGIAWLPDSKTIAFDGLQDPEGEATYRSSNIYTIDIESGQMQRLTTEPGNWTSPAVSGNGRKIAFLGHPETDEAYRLPRLHVMNSDGSDFRQLGESFDLPVSAIFWSSDHRGVYFTAEDHGYSNIFYMSLEGKARNVTTGQAVASLQSVNAKTTLGAGVVSSYHQPGDIHTFLLKSQGEPTKLTGVNDDLLARKALGQQEELWFEASDGNKAHGWLITPPDFDPKKTYPLLMEIHGGPFAMYAGAFDFQYQVYAANGFVVLYTNPRGSTGYGEEYTRAINPSYPGVDYLDLIAGVDAAIERGYIDEDRLYVGGCSGGGILASWMIAHTDRFAAAAVRCPVTNWVSMAGNTDIPYVVHSFFDQPFWENPEEWLGRSSLMHVENVSTPTLILTGVNDMRTPISQSEEYYAALKMLGIPTRLVRFNDEYHGTGSRPSNYMRTMLYMMSWYEQHKLNNGVRP